MAVEWGEYLAVGVEQIDAQHREIFRQVNLFMEAMAQGSASTRVIEVLNFLVEYTVNHFHDEEGLMAESGYPRMEYHKKEHEKFCQEVMVLKGRIDVEGATKQNVLLTSQAMLHWLVQHILNTDKTLAEHMRSTRL